MLKGLAKLVGGSDERTVKKLRPTVESINELEPEFEGLSDDQLGAKADQLRGRLGAGEELDDVLAYGVEAHALFHQNGRPAAPVLRVIGVADAPFVADHRHAAGRS